MSAGEIGLADAGAAQEVSGILVGGAQSPLLQQRLDGPVGGALLHRAQELAPGILFQQPADEKDGNLVIETTR